MSKLNLLKESLELLNETITIANGINTNTDRLSKADNNFTEGNRILRSAGNNKRLLESNATIDNNGLLTATSFSSTNRSYNGYILPASDGTNGQVLQTDGSGNLSFTTVSSGGSGNVTTSDTLTNNYLIVGNGNTDIDASSIYINNDGDLVTANIDGNNISGAAIVASTLLTVSGNINSTDSISGANLFASSNVSATGNITTINGTVRGKYMFATNNITVGTSSSTNSQKGQVYVNGLGGTSTNAQYVYVKDGGSAARIGRTTATKTYSIYSQYHIRAMEFHAHSDDRLKTQEEYITNATETLMKLTPQGYYKKPLLDSEYQEQLNNWNTQKNELQVKINEIETIDVNDRTDEQNENLTNYNNELTELNNNQPLNEEKWESGLIAQEIFYDVPELRHIVTSGINASDTILEQPEGYGNDDPTIDPDYSNWGESPAGINYTQLIPFLIKGFQEQQEIINQQQTTINNLTSRIEVLESQ